MKIKLIIRIETFTAVPLWKIRDLVLELNSQDTKNSLKSRYQNVRQSHTVRVTSGSYENVTNSSDIDLRNESNLTYQFYECM